MTPIQIASLTLHSLCLAKFAIKLPLEFARAYAQCCLGHAIHATSIWIVNEFNGCYIGGR